MPRPIGLFYPFTAIKCTGNQVHPLLDTLVFESDFIQGVLSECPFGELDDATFGVIVSVHPALFKLIVESTPEFPVIKT